MPDPTSVLERGQTLDPRFKLVRPLGQGGMAEVWLAHDNELGEEVVAKILPPDAPAEHVAMLQRECREARRLVHPGIARVYEFHRTGDRAFLTMEYVDGPDIGQLRGRPLAEILPAAVSVAGALAYAHSRGVIHRDLKVSNVLCTRTGNARLIDFGIAGRLTDEQTRLRGGGSRYSASPQQLGGGEPDSSDDIYSFGVLLYELTSGHPPFWPDISEERVRSETPAPLAGPEALPESYRSLVQRLLAKQPADRPPDMAAVESELQRIRAGLAGSEIQRTVGEADRVRLDPPPRVTTIEPIPMRSAVDQDGSARRRSIASRLGMPIGLVAVTVALLLFVFVLLPQWAPSPTEPGDDAEAGEAAAAGTRKTVDDSPDVGRPQGPTEDRQERAYRRQRAEEALGRLVELREDLESRAVDAWGGQEYGDALSHAESGDAHLASADYAAAQEDYERAIQLLDELGAEAVDVLRRALADGEEALAAGEEARATAAFALAADIAPANQTAARGLRRARVVDEVAEALAEARDRERVRDWIGAERAYQQAVALDSMSLVAQESLARVRTHISDDLFAGFMSRGLGALQRGEFAVARQAFEEAAKIRPDSVQVAEGFLQLDEAEKLDAFADHRTKATRLEADEEWVAAAEEYEAVTRLAPNVAFARQGASRCRSRADLARRMAYHLDHPDRLSSDQVLAEVERLVAEASELEPSGPRHERELGRLIDLLARSRTVVRIRLESDNLTDVMVYRVGRLGPFLQHDLELRPGRYTVVGTRQGYRDVRHEFVVVAGEVPGPLVVRCQEKI